MLAYGGNLPFLRNLTLARYKAGPLWDGVFYRYAEFLLMVGGIQSFLVLLVNAGVRERLTFLREALLIASSGT